MNEITINLSQSQSQPIIAISKLTNKGDTGDQGIPGVQGIPGITGSQGIQGVKGDPGDIGTQGIPGLKGDPGITGGQGVQGIPGDAGSSGVKGDKGDPGNTGAQGIQGIPGAMEVLESLPLNGTQGKIYFSKADNKFYQWVDVPAGWNVVTIELPADKQAIMNLLTDDGDPVDPWLMYNGKYVMDATALIVDGAGSSTATTYSSEQIVQLLGAKQNHLINESDLNRIIDDGNLNMLYNGELAKSFVMVGALPATGLVDRMYYLKSDRRFYEWNTTTLIFDNVISAVPTTSVAGGGASSATILTYKTAQEPFPQSLGQVAVNTDLGVIVSAELETASGILPTFTAATNGNMTVTSSLAYSTYSGYKAFDKSTVSSGAGNYFRSDTGAAADVFVQLDCGKWVSISEYTIKAVDSFQAASPQAWTLYGSNDGVVYDQIDVQSGQTAWVSGEARTFTLFVPSVYRYVKFVVNVGNNATYVNIGDIDIAFKNLYWKDSNFHANMDYLNKIGESGNGMTYNGSPISAAVTTVTPNGTYTIAAGATQTVPMTGEHIVQLWKVLSNDIQPNTINVLTPTSTISSSSVNGTNTPAKAIDDPSLATYFQSATPGPNEWVMIDHGLGTEKAVCSVAFTYPTTGYGPKTVKIQTSSDAVSWADMYSGVLSSGLSNTVNFQPAGTRRYTRLLITDSWYTVMRIKDMKMFEGTTSMVRQLVDYSADGIQTTYEGSALSVKNNGASSINIRVNVLS